ncbi:MAG: hypothetical protein LH632_10840 [Rhodoferax sp.]|nr:hypothetical protein [Rhodoferax sp.]
MWYAISWIAVLFLLSLWTLLAWATHAAVQWVAGLSGEQVGSAAGGVTDAAKQMGALQLPDWLMVWLPAGALKPWTDMAASLMPWITSMLGQAPALIGWLSPLVWVTWAAGAFLLLALGAGLSLVIRVMQRRSRGTANG